MKIEIKKKGNQTAILVSFDMNKEKITPTEKSKFFAELYGREQVIRKQNKIYRYHREGLLTPNNHIKVDNSVFIVAMEQMKKMEEFMNEWEKKVMFRMFPVILDKNEAEQLETEKVSEESGFKLLDIPKEKRRE